VATSIWDSVLNEWNALLVQPLVPGVVRAPWARLVWPRIQRVNEYTGIPLLIYVSACTAPARKAPSELLSIDVSDKTAFHSMLEALDGPRLDVLIHSPGGYADATETIVEEIRRKFGYVRFIVPSYAKSAAAMMVMSGDEILIDEDADLGPIDPQFMTPGGAVAAEAIKEQFRRASEEILKDAKKVQVWYPILQTLGMGTLASCDNAIELSKQIVADWLSKYMFRADSDAKPKAEKVAGFLSSPDWKSHGRRIKLEHLKPLDLHLTNLRDDVELYRRVWELHCALDIVLINTAIYKIYYNSADVGIVRQQQPQAPGIQLLLGQPGILPPGAIPQPGSPAPAAPAPTPAPAIPKP
jgi:hypothetical protein